MGSVPAHTPTAFVGVQPEVAQAIRALETNSQAGGAGSTASFGGEGNLNCQGSAAGVGNAADATDDVLFTYTLPASALDVAGRALTITALGKYAANNNSKNVKLWFGATVVATTGAQTTAANAVGWQLQAEVIKLGAAGANTQIAQGQNIFGTTHGGVSVPAAPTEVESGPIVIKVTGASGASAANDILGQLFQVNWMN